MCVASVPGFATTQLCEELVGLCEQHGFGAERAGSGYTQATVDLEVDAAPTVRAWLLRRGLLPAISRCMRATHGAAPAAFDDVFVVKYDATGTSDVCQQALEMHCDAGDVSFMLALSPREAYSGGGTFFEALCLGAQFVNEGERCRGGTLHLPQGELLLFDAALRHAGVRISAGTRYLLVGFCLVGGGPPLGGCIDLNLKKLP